MTESGLPSSSNENLDCEDEGNIVTMVDVLKAEESLEENADAVLGPGDDKNCTYDEGYLKRQALYSCLTCLPADGADHAGICLACSYHCHSDHELVELYTKRNFRCDCGNDLFKGTTCTLTKKSGINKMNKYNQNFQGAYCSCHRPYPDPEDTVEDEMIQCIVCEDWYHTRHLGSFIPKEDEYAEMVCSTCMDSLLFLQSYLSYSVNNVSKSKNESVGDISVDDDTALNVQEKKVYSTQASDGITSKNENCDSNGTEAKIQNIVANDNNEMDIKETNGSDTADTKEKITDTNVCQEKIIESEDCNAKSENGSTEKPSVEAHQPSTECNNKGKDGECLLNTLEKLPREDGATFWTDELRKMLCRCTKCMDMYKERGVLFLIDEEDTVKFYESTGKSRKQKDGTTQYERGMEALSSLDRVQQMEAILSYNEMKTSLSEYLAKFVENKKVVREEDIREFFSDMKARKRQRLDIPHSCR